MHLVVKDELAGEGVRPLGCRAGLGSLGSTDREQRTKNVVRASSDLLNNKAIDFLPRSGAASRKARCSRKWLTRIVPRPGILSRASLAGGNCACSAQLRFLKV